MCKVNRRKTHWWGDAFYSRGKQVTPGERRIGGGVHFTPGGSKLLRSNMHWGCKLLRGALYFVTGQYTDDSVVLRKLCSAIDAFVYTTTLSGFAIIGLLKIRHLAASIPKEFSITLRALLNQ